MTTVRVRVRVRARTRARARVLDEGIDVGLGEGAVLRLGRAQHHIHRREDLAHLWSAL